MPPKKKPRKDAPVSLDKLKFTGEPAFILSRLKTCLEERDRYITRLENENADLGKCAARVFSALEEAEGMASHYPQYVQDALNDQAKYKSRMAEMGRYQRLFHEAKNDFQRLRP